MTDPSDNRASDLQAETQEQPVRRLLVFCIIALALMMMAVDGTIVATALDAIKTGLDTSVNWVGWTITAYAFGFVVMLPISGKLSARYGNRKVFLGSVIAFTTASLLCGLASNIYMLIVLRALQAAGGAGFTPAATGIIVQHFGDARDRAVGMFGSMFPLGAMIGPILGGLFVTYWNWRAIFLVNVPIGLLVALLVLRHVPLDKPNARRGRSHFDGLGLALMGLCLIAGMLAATYMGNADARLWSPIFLLPLAVSLITLVLFLRHIKHHEYPFILPRLIHGRGFGTVNFVNIMYGGGVAGIRVLVPLYAINRYGLSALDAGTLLIAQAVAAIVFSSTAAFALRITGYRLPIYFGAVVIALGMLLLALPPAFGLSPYVWLASATFLLGVGGGSINPPSRNAGLQLEPELAPAIAAVRSMCMHVGRIITISIATAIIASAADPGLTQAWIYAAAVLVLLAALPSIRRVPEHVGAW